MSRTQQACNWDDQNMVEVTQMFLQWKLFCKGPLYGKEEWIILSLVSKHNNKNNFWSGTPVGGQTSTLLSLFLLIPPPPPSHTHTLSLSVPCWDLVEVIAALYLWYRFWDQVFEVLLCRRVCIVMFEILDNDSVQSFPHFQNETMSPFKLRTALDACNRIPSCLC